jgi:hypothetical protein
VPYIPVKNLIAAENVAVALAFWEHNLHPVKNLHDYPDESHTLKFVQWFG